MDKSESEELKELLGDELFEALFRETVSAISVPLLRRLLGMGLIDLDEVENPRYLLSVMRQHGSLVEEMEWVMVVDDTFSEAAVDAVSQGKQEIALILVATAIEHLLNNFYRDLLGEKGISDKLITEIIRRNNIHAKRGWLMAVTCQQQLPEAMEKLIDIVVELRNAVVHYKHVPVPFSDDLEWETMENRIESLDWTAILALPSELDTCLRSTLMKMYPDLGLAVKLSETVRQHLDQCTIEIR